ncbi:hypothetical protein OA57_07500 [Chelonobacter oris]|uniref:Autotransporter domain-containing protein n=1 Tax=Chelonobacter oris TaxID=505317 RepID=A0A0A3B9F2_9PAST|nr:S6 family peptidase [Chelonobacter oris]KGQ70169.1 hypothetical protein OA57_07500 [Chelonobacter oris]
MSFKPNKLAVLISTALLSYPAFTSIVRDDISYQIFRDFAENKGEFIPGSTDFEIFTNNGTLVGVLNKAPMIDFSSVNTFGPPGVATLVNQQYVAGVKHNRGYQNIYFGSSGNNPDYLRQRYELVDRNEHNTKDLHIPRLHKYVTDVAPIAITDAGMSSNVYKNQTRFPIFYRLGSGDQQVRDSSGKNTWVAGSYTFLTGGTVRTPVFSNATFYNENGALYDKNNEPLAMQGQPGDSGSPLFGWDTTLGKWVIVGVLHGIAGNTSNWWIVVDKPFAEQHFKTDQAPDIQNSGDLIWKRDTADKLGNNGGTSVLTQTSELSWHVKLADSESNNHKQSLNHGQNVNLNGSGTITLSDNINQGAGGLTFNGDYTVKPETNQTWVGAGVNIAKDNTVTWQVNGIDNDFLHKIGEGTLVVNAEGKNHGNLSVGDGTVILKQQAGDQSAVQAFDKIQIVSGRPTVVLSDNKQVNPDNIYFGFRGGRLDLNGNDFAFSRIRNVDNGAQIVNHHQQKAATVNITGVTDTPIYTWNNSQRGTIGTLYKYINTHRGNRIDYFILKKSTYSWFPTNAAGNNDWAFAGHEEAKAKDTVLSQQNKAVFLGVLGETDAAKHNGKLNFHYHSPIDGGIYTLAGGSNLNGEIKVEKGTLLLSGRPTPHAGNITIDSDWITTHFKAARFIAANGAALQLGNYANLEGDLSAEKNSKISLGYINDKNAARNSLQCTLNDGSGLVNCHQNALSETLYTALPPAKVNGNITLAESAVLNLGKTDFSGKIQAEKTSRTQIGHDAVWNMTDNSTLGILEMDNGSSVNLNGNSDTNRFHTLTINSDLNGSGQFVLNADLAAQKSDRIVVNGLAKGHYLLKLGTIGEKAASSSGFLPLLTLNHARQDWEAITVALPNHYLDIGAYRYVLTRKNKHFALYNALQPTLASKDAPLPSATETGTIAADEATDSITAESGVESRATPNADISIRQQQWTSRTVNTALSDHAARINQLNKQQRQLNQYLQRLNGSNSGVWLNADHEEMRYNSDNYRTYKQRLATRQIGADKAMPFNRGDWLSGIAFTHSRANNTFAENQNGNSIQHTFSWYNKVIFDNRFYLTSVISYHDLNARLNRQKIRQNAITATIGFGQRLQLGSIGVTPSADVSYYRLAAGDYRHENIRFHSDSMDFWQLRTGIMLDKTFAITAKANLKLYSAFNYVQNFHEQQTLYADNHAFGATLFKNRVESELGAVFGLGKRFNITLKGGYAHGDAIQSQFNAGVDVKYRW